MVGNNLTDLQLQQLVDRTIIKADLVTFLIYRFRTMMEKYHTQSSRIWLRILISEENLKSTKYDLINILSLLNRNTRIFIDCFIY